MTQSKDAPVPSEPELPSSTRAVIEAFTTLTQDLDTPSVLQSIVRAACDLTDSQYGALGVTGTDGQLSAFVTVGVDEDIQTLIGQLPTGAGLLDPSSSNGQPLRLDDLTEHSRAAGFPEEHPPMRSLLLVPINVGGALFGHLYLAEKADGRSFTHTDELLIQSLADVAGYAIDNARAYGRSERRRKWLEVFSDLSSLLQPPISLETALQRIAVAVREASGAESASVVQVPESGGLITAATSGDAPRLSAADRAKLDRAVRTVSSTGVVTEVALARGRGAVLAPLTAHLTRPGVLILSHHRSGELIEEEQSLLASFAHQAALALDRAQALEDRQQMAVVADRDRIARDLHDVVIQRLFATGLHLQSLRAAAPTADLKERIDKSVKDLDQTIRDIRGTIFDLQTRPRKSLRIEVRDLVRESQPLLGHIPRVETQGPVDSPIDREVQQQLVAVLREALANVAQHSGTSSTSVELHVEDDSLRLVVADTGRGLPPKRNERGLRNIRRRAAILGGSLTLTANSPHGTVLTWAVPLSATAGAAVEVTRRPARGTVAG